MSDNSDIRYPFLIVRASCALLFGPAAELGWLVVAAYVRPDLLVLARMHTLASSASRAASSAITTAGAPYQHCPQRCASPQPPPRGCRRRRPLHSLRVTRASERPAHEYEQERGSKSKNEISNTNYSFKTSWIRTKFEP